MTFNEIFLVGVAVTFVAAIPIVIWRAGEDFGDDRNAFSFAIAGGAVMAVAVAAIWPLLIPIGILYGLGRMCWNWKNRPPVQAIPSDPDAPMPWDKL
jgi:hypothetical protein